ncbi:MAG: hypothetical protein AUK31_07545 [Fibrobacteres bacterium CG2_30_45_31]|nr:MAG: hypothetical protein AUK31_07545 [Fibrobacteres bacterium CG2_30_45_31]
MIKRIALMLAITVASSFASWDLFPVKAAGDGQAKLIIPYIWEDDNYITSASLGARYTVVQGLEISLYNVAYTTYGWKDVNNENKTESGFADIVLGVRYWFPFNLGLFLDASLPTGDKDLFVDCYAFREGIQYAILASDAFKIGTEVNLTTYTKGDFNGVTYSTGPLLTIATEFDYTIGMVTPFLEGDISSRLAKTKVSGDYFSYKLDDKKSAYAIGLGARIDFNSVFTLEGEFITGSDFEETDLQHGVSLAAYVNF